MWNNRHQRQLSKNWLPFRKLGKSCYLKGRDYFLLNYHGKWLEGVITELPNKLYKKDIMGICMKSSLLSALGKIIDTCRLNHILSRMTMKSVRTESFSININVHWIYLIKKNIHFDLPRDYYQRSIAIVPVSPFWGQM